MINLKKLIKAKVARYQSIPSTVFHQHFCDRIWRFRIFLGIRICDEGWDLASLNLSIPKSRKSPQNWWRSLKMLKAKKVRNYHLEIVTWSRITQIFAIYCSFINNFFQKNLKRYFSPENLAFEPPWDVTPCNHFKKISNFFKGVQE